MLRRAFKHASAAQRKQRIPDEGDAVVGKVINDVAPGVAGRVVNCGPALAQLERVAFTHLHVDARNAFGIGARTNNGASGFFP